MEVLEYNGIDPAALPIALKRIESYLYTVGDFYSLAGGNSHPSMKSRINVPYNDIIFDNPEYDVTISMVLSQNALYEYYKGHHIACEALLDRLIAGGIATEEDMILKSMVIRKLYNSEEKLNEALSWILKAETLSVYPVIGLKKQKGLTYLRLNNQEMASIAFTEYLRVLENTEMNPAIDEEIKWAKKMVYKTNKL